MSLYHWMNRSRKAISGLLAIIMTTSAVPASGSDLVAQVRARWHNHKGVPSAEALAVEIQSLEKHIDCFGTIVAKQPDVWGQARMMKHRQEYEKVLFKQLGEFKSTLQASVSRTDQAFLASAFSLSAAISGAPAVQLPQSASVSQEIVSRQRALLKAQGVKKPTTEQIQAAPAPTPIEIPSSNPASDLVDNFDTQGVLQRRDITSLGTGVTLPSDSISLEPTVFLDQMSRYLNHLNELRRINEGDDTADSPGYGLHLVRIPVSVLPGSMTRKGYGAEITVTATPYLGRDLLPSTFRNLVINDVVVQSSSALTEFFNSPNALTEFRKSQKILEDRSKAAAFQARSGMSYADAYKPYTSDSLYLAQVKESIGKSVRVPSRAVPSTRTRNARFAFPNTQMGEVYGGDLILPVALQAFDVALRNRLEDDPDEPVNVQYHRLAGHIQDQVVAAYDFLARPESAHLWNNFATPELAAAVRSRDKAYLTTTRTSFLAALPNGGQEQEPAYGPMANTTAAFAWALLVESVLLNERLIQDMYETASAKGMPAPAAEGLPFFLPCPPDEARNAFNEYVRIRFPIHVFALDPVNQEQNIADQLSRTRELQLALSLAFVTGNISAGSMTRFARRMELQAETIALNRTQVSFSHGEDVFGWRFQPRYQTPPTQSNLTAFAQTLVGGPTRDGDRRQLELESGMRECVALVIMPSFVPYATFETRTNWYRLNSPKHSEIDALKFLALSKSIQKARNLAQTICDAGLYRDGDIARLLTRVNQLAAELPMQTMIAQVPYENSHGGFELFNVGVTDLGPELRSWYGAPGVSIENGTSLFLVGDSFSVHQTSVVVGNKLINSENGDVSLLSRQVMRINVPPGTQPLIRGGRPFVEASIATPYGVSQPLYIPVLEPPAKQEAPAPASAYSINTRTQTLNIFHTLRDDAGNPRAGDGQVDTSTTPRIDILWTSPTGIAPREIEVDFSFQYKGALIDIPLSRRIKLTGANQGFYRINGADLELIAQEYVTELNSLDTFSLANPLPSLETTSIVVTPVSGGAVLDTQSVAVTNKLKVVPTPIGRIAGGGTSQLPGAAPAPPFAPQTSPPPATAPVPAPGAPSEPTPSIPPLPDPSAPRGADRRVPASANSIASGRSRATAMPAPRQAAANSSTSSRFSR